MNIGKLMDEAEGLRLGRYGCAINDIFDIRDAAGGEGLAFGDICFRIGFLQGQKAAKAEAKREKKQLMERDTSGWYAYLSRWLERNIENERLLGLVGVFARKLEGAVWKKAKEEVTPNE